MTMHEHMQHVFGKFVVKLSVVSEVLFSIIKLTQDTRMELIETICCKYYLEVATHLNVPFVGQTLP